MTNATLIHTTDRPNQERVPGPAVPKAKATKGTTTPATTNATATLLKRVAVSLACSFETSFSVCVARSSGISSPSLVLLTPIRHPGGPPQSAACRARPEGPEGVRSTGVLIHVLPELLVGRTPPPPSPASRIGGSLSAPARVPGQSSRAARIASAERRCTVEAAGVAAS